MTSAQPTTTQPTASGGPGPGPAAEPSRSWIPPIPRPLQRLFDAVPLVTYPPNELPRRSPAPTSADLPTLHVFSSDRDAARGRPSFNPSCLKWQTYLRLSGIQHTLVPSTNHASPTGSLPFLQPALPTNRLDARHLLPVPSTRLDTYARQHGAPPPPPPTTSDARHRRQQAYQALLDGPVRAAWLHALYLSPANEPLLRNLYVDPASRSGAVRRALLQQLRRAARREVGGTGDDLLAWPALGGRRRTCAVGPHEIYEGARAAFRALEALLEDESEGERGQPWFFGAPGPTLFDAGVFSYTYLILHDEYSPDVPWGDDALRRTVRDCPLLVAHAERILGSYW